MQRKYSQAAANYTLSDPISFACGMPRKDAFHLLQEPGSDDTPWTGAFSGLTFMGMYYWCFDQVFQIVTKLRNWSFTEEKNPPGTNGTCPTIFTCSLIGNHRSHFPPLMALCGF